MTTFVGLTSQGDTNGQLYVPAEPGTGPWAPYDPAYHPDVSFSDLYFGVPSQFIQWAYWNNAVQLNVASMFARYAGSYSFSDSQGNGGFSFPSTLKVFVAPPGSSDALKKYVQKHNSELVETIFKGLDAYQTSLGNGSQAAAYDKITQLRIKPYPIDVYQWEYGAQSVSRKTVNVGPALADAINDFVVQNGRLPAVMFSDYSGDTRLPAPVFTSDELGYLCPTWAALSILATQLDTGYSKLIYFTDYGPRFLNEAAYLNFQKRFWAIVAPRTDCFEFQEFFNSDGLFDSVNYFIGFQIVKIKAPVNSIEPGPAMTWNGSLYPVYNHPITCNVVDKVASTYSFKLREAEHEAQKNASNAVTISFIGAVMTFLGLGAMLSAFGSLLNGEFAIQNILQTVKLGQSFKLYDAGDTLKVLSFLNGSNLPQSFIDKLGDSPTTYGDWIPFDDLPNDAAVTVTVDDLVDVPVIEIPVDTIPPLGDTVPNLPTFGDSMDDDWFDFDWDSFDGDTIDDIDVDDPADWFWETPGDDLNLSIDDATDWAEVEFDDDGFWDQSGEYFFWEELQPGFELSDLADMYGDVSLEQFGVLNGVSPEVIAKAGAVLTTVGGNAGSSSTKPATAAAGSAAAKTAASSGSTFDSILGNAAGLLSLYTQYQVAQGKITVPKAGQITAPKTPGQMVKQPDGSISVMNADGSISTIKPNGQKVTTKPGAKFSIGGIDGKTLLIGGGVLAAVVAISLISDKPKRRG